MKIFSVEDQRIREKILLAIMHLIGSHAWKVVFFFSFLTLLSVFYALKNLDFKTGRSDLISPHLRYNQNFQKYRVEFGNYDGFIVVAKGENPERLKEFMEVLGERLKSDTHRFRDVFYKIDTEYFRDKMFLFLKEEELNDLFHELRENENFISLLNEELGIVNLFRQINFKISSAMVGHLVDGLLETSESKQEEEKPADLSLLNTLLEQMNLWLDGERRFKSPWSEFLNKKAGGRKEEGYITTSEERMFFMTVNPVENIKSFTRAKGALSHLRKYLSEIRNDFPDIEAGVTGQSALESDEMVATQKDTMKASVLALAGVTLLFIFAFRGLLKPTLAIISLVVSLCWTLGWTALWVGHLNVISVVFITVLIGLGIDFGIHLILRYEEEKTENGFPVEEALAKAIQGTGKGILVGALTTAFAFFSMTFADFTGIVELGIIAGSGILLSLVSMLVLLPALLHILERRKWKLRLIDIWNRSDVTIHLNLLERALLYPRTLLAIGILWGLISIYFFSTLKFDYNILRLQNETTESVHFEMEIINNSERSTWYAAIVTESLAQARKLKNALKNLPTVGEIESILSIFPDDQNKKIERVRALRETVPVFSPMADTIEEEVDGGALAKVLRKICFKLQEDETSWPEGKRPEEGDIAAADQLAKQLLDKIESIGEKAEKILAHYQQRLFDDYRDKFTTLARSLDPTPVTLEGLPQAIRERYIGKTGKYLIQVFPKENIWEREPLEQFVDDLRTVDPDVTGLAVQASETAKLMKDGYVQGGIYALLTIVLITFFSFKKLLNSFLAICPLFIGFLWLIGLMELFDLQFNLANLVILPLIIGIGVDNGVHILARYQEGDLEDPVSIIFRSTGKAIMLCSLTTMIGFGSLMVAHHYGIYSIGLLLTLGVGSCLVASTTVLPILLHMGKKRII